MRFFRHLFLFMSLAAALSGKGEPCMLYDQPDPVGLPELLKTSAGRAVETANDWETVRRAEILKFFEENVYGVRPVERPQDLTFAQQGPDERVLDGRAVRKCVRASFSGPRGAWHFDFYAFLPTWANRKRPVPSFLVICNRDLEKWADPSLRTRSEFFPVEEIIGRGYAALVFRNTQLGLDGDDYRPQLRPNGTVELQDPDFTNGFYACWAERRTERSWGAISAWAWGASRVMDWIETEPALDARHVAVVGHSRGGKTALWAAASDTRFALACVNDSGCCGAKLNHAAIPKSETIGQDNKNNPHWFARAYRQFNGRDFLIPFDQHWLAALVAPRLLYVASASEDEGAGPWGEFLTARHASPAWALYGKRGLVEDHDYAVEKPYLNGSVGYHLRAGGHDLRLYDWSRFMDFTDRHGWRNGLLVFHFDFNTLQRTKGAVVSILERVASAGYGAVLWEIENKVRFDSCPEIAAPDAFTKDEFREILSVARRLGLEPIPLMQTFGHAEYVLRVPEHVGLRELSDRYDCYCPSKPETRVFLKRLLHEYLELFGDDVRRFHLGGDEVWSFASCPACKARKPVDLYREHLEAVSEELRAKGVRPGCWHDMLLKFAQERGDEAFGGDFRDYTVWFWDYSYPKAGHWWGRSDEPLRRLMRVGCETIVCGSIQSWKEDPFTVRYADHRENLAACADLARREGLSGFCVTSWTVHQGLKQLQFPLSDYAAKRYLSPNPCERKDWEDSLTGSFGPIPAEVLSDLTCWQVRYGLADGRALNRYKDGLVPTRDYLMKRLEEENVNPAELAAELEAVADRTAAALDRIRLVPEGELTSLGCLLIEASELRVAHHRAAARSLRGEPVGTIPLARSIEHYLLECPRESAERAARIAYAICVGQ